MSMFKRVSNGLCLLGGADTVILNECPSNERRKFYISALTNFYQSIVSAVAMAVTFYSINRNWPPLFIFCIASFFGFFCFIINLGLTGSVSRARIGNLKNTLLIIGAFLLRALISVIISLLSSQVLELYVFRDFFPYAQRKQEIAASQNLQNTMESKFQEKEALKEYLDNIDQEIQTWHMERNTLFESDAILADYIQQRQILLSRLDSLTSQYRNLNNISSERIASAQRSIAAINNELNSLRGNDTQRQIDALNSQIAALNSFISQENTERNRRNTELNNLQQRITVQEGNINQRREQIDVDNRDRTRELYAKREMAAATLANAETEIAAFIKENDRAASDSFLKSSLIQNLITLQFIEAWKDNPEATFEERATADTIPQVRLLIMAIFLLGDLSPLIIMLFYKPGIYELRQETKKDIQEAICVLMKQQEIAKAKIDIQSKHRIAEKQTDSETVLKEIEIFYEYSKAFYHLQCDGRENAMNQIYNLNRRKFADPKKEMEVADTELFIKKTFEQTQEHAANMFWTCQNRTRVNFVRTVNGDD